MATKKKIKVPKSPEKHPVYSDEIDKEYAKQLEQYAGSDAKKIPKPLQVRTMGLSFGAYSEHKIMGADGVHDPWIQKSTGVNLPNNYIPRLTTQPVNVTRGELGQFTVKPYTADEIKHVGTFTTQQDIDIFTGDAIPFAESNMYVGSTMTASTKLKQRIIWPKYYQNPYQYQDYIYLQDIYANTICGRIFDTIGFFALANGIKPKLKIRNEGMYDTDEEKQKILKDHRWVIDTLIEIEKNISTSSTPKGFGEGINDAEFPIGPIATAPDAKTPTYDTSLQKKWFACFINEMMFGRSMMVPRIDENDNTVKVNVKKGGEECEYHNIPKIMQVIHPRDMGFNYVDYITHRLLGIQLNNSNWIIRPDEMIFFEWMPDNPVYGSKFYGMSAAQSMMGSARTLRRIIEVDFPLIAKTRWSGMYWLVFKRKGEGVGNSDEELRRILQNIELNGINATLEDEPKDDFILHKIDLDPKIQELLQTVKDLINYMMGQVGLPQGLLYGEQDLNRDTLKTKIASWSKGALKRFRQPFLDGVTDQWYRRLTKTLENQSEEWEEAMKIVEVVADVEEFKLESREELLNTLMMLENLTGKWKVDAEEKFLEMEGLQDKIDPDKGPEDLPPMPGGGGGGFDVKDKGTGKEFGVSPKQK